ncbi:tumor necrosis factor receptor superfamily member 5-like [Symphorus nematophorus]
MHLLQLLMMMWPFMVMATAQPHCDPLTQYPHNGQCCKMCGPGTSMSSFSTCMEPQCQECGRNEYQDKYTRESKCKHQPFCDPDRNFQMTAHESKKQSTCMCKLGFHCATEDCTACVLHRGCEPGYGVQSKGKHTHDTVCHKCPEGTYSDETSRDGVCKKWTECGNGQHILQKGTDISNSICVETSRTQLPEIGVVFLRIGVVFLGIGVVFLVIGVVLIAALLFWLCRGKQGDVKGKVKGCVRSCLTNKKEPLREATVLTATLTDSVDEESRVPQEQSWTTEESEDEPSMKVLTDNGYLIMQEAGKTPVLSLLCQRSQSMASMEVFIGL